jgi:hypothetical protein
MNRGWIVLQFVIAFVLLLGMQPAGVWADPSVGVGNIYSAPVFVPGAWTPLRATLINDTAAEIDGHIEMPVTGKSGTIIYRIPVAVPPHSDYRTTFNIPLTMPPSLEKVDNEGAKEVSIIRWVQSKDIAQTSILMRPPKNAGEDAPRRMIILNLAADIEDENAPQEPSALIKPIEDTIGISPMIWRSVVSNAATHPAAYDSCLLVVLHLADAPKLNIAQRDALLAYIRRGGTLLIAAPTEAAALRDSWLEPYLPVQPIGYRVATKLQTEHDNFKLPKPVTLCEAVGAAGGTILLKDAHYVHAAYKPLGLGRVAFTSFPIDAIPFSSDAARDFWQSLLNFSTPDPTWVATRFPQEQTQLLRTMIGSPAPSRASAIAIASGFVLLVVVMQLLWRGTRRPRAFAGGIVAALLLSGVLIVLGLVSQKGAALTGGRNALLKIGQSGGGLMQEVAAFTGDAAELSLSVPDNDATLKPVAYDRTASPVVQINPYSAPQAGVAPRRIDRVWQADAPLPINKTANATGRFDATGFHISIDNRLGGKIASPLLVRRSRIYRLPDLATGQSTVTLEGADRNLPAASGAGISESPAQAQERAQQRSLLYMNGGTLINNLDKTRASIASAIFEPSHGTLVGGTVQPPSMIVGWVDDSATKPLIQPSATPANQQSLNMVMFPMDLSPSPPGSKVAIDGGMTTLVVGPIPMPVYDSIKGNWLPTNLPGEWLIGVRAPQGIGKLIATGATIHLNISLPVQTLTISRGQVSNGKIATNLRGEVVARYEKTFGSQAAKSFAISPADIDDSGTVWFRLQVEVPPTGDSVAPFWSITDFSVDLEGQIAPSNP